MEVDNASRYRSRILREMKANRDNPFNSPPSSTGSHGDASPTVSSVFSDPDGESTRKLNEDIARIMGPNKLPVNFEAAHRKWPEYYGMPKARGVPIFEDDDTNTRPLSADSKENKPPGIPNLFADEDSTRDLWKGSTRPRSEMQPRVDDGSDLSSILVSKSPARGLSVRDFASKTRNPSPLAKVHSQTYSSEAHNQRRTSLSDALDTLRKSSASRSQDGQRRTASAEHSGGGSPHMSSAKSSLTAVPPSPESMNNSPSHNASHVRSFFMPDVSHLGDFVTGTLRFSGSMRNGVPIFVKQGRVHDRLDRSSLANHAGVDAIEVPEDEEKIFVSMDMIRNEIISLQEHYDKVQEYASNLQQQVESLEAELKSRPAGESRILADRTTEELRAKTTTLENQISSLQSRLEQANRKISVHEIENDSLTHERDRAVRKLQEACEDINKLTKKLSVRERELETSQRQLETTDNLRHDNDTLRRNLVSLKHGRDALELENAALRDEKDRLLQEADPVRSDMETLRKQYQSLIAENRTLRTNNQTLMADNEELHESLETVQHELVTVKEQVESLNVELENVRLEKTTLQEDNDSLVRHNEKYFSDNKILRRENSGFERSMHSMHDENLKLKDEIEALREQLDVCRPIPKDDFSARLDEETEENMTSAFFIPDITIQSDNTGAADNTDTNGLPAPPELTSPHTKLSTIPDATEEQTDKSIDLVKAAKTAKQASQSRAKNSTKESASQAKVAFSIPETSIRSSKSTTNVANKGSKRRSTSQSSLKKSQQSDNNLYLENDDSTGFQSKDNTQEQQQLQEDFSQKLSVQQNLTKHSSKSQHRRSHSQSSQRRETTLDKIATTTESCPALSPEARRVLDDLCAHNCRNCTVCSRISSHRGILSSSELASGKKRVTVPRPIPVTERDLPEDHTMRPARSPGHALAVVIKGLHDEVAHMQLELTRLQAAYNSTDGAVSRRERLSISASINDLLTRLDAKNDQIYSLHDVLEGQKAVGQAMSEEEIEWTVLSITGMTVRDVTSGSEQLTWEGIPDL